MIFIVFVMWSDEILIFHHWPQMEPKWWFTLLVRYLLEFNTVSITYLELYCIDIVELIELFDLVEIHRTDKICNIFVLVANVFA